MRTCIRTHVSYTHTHICRPWRTRLPRTFRCSRPSLKVHPRIDAHSLSPGTRGVFFFSYRNMQYRHPFYEPLSTQKPTVMQASRSASMRCARRRTSSSATLSSGARTSGRAPSWQRRYTEIIVAGNWGGVHVETDSTGGGGQPTHLHTHPQVVRYFEEKVKQKMALVEKIKLKNVAMKNHRMKMDAQVRLMPRFF